jgi:CheY-like chemotaxis protein
MDLNLPVLDGLSATQAIRKLPHGDIPIIAITANTFSGEQQNCLNYGITQVLTKPIDKVTLEMALLPHRSSGNPISITPNIHKAIDLQPMILDHRAINNLITDLGKDKVIKLLDMYRIDALSLVKQMRESTLQERHSYAHTLAGMSDNLGIVSVGKSARAIMDAGNSDSQSLHPLIEDLEHQFENSTREIQNLLQTNDMETR